MIFNYKYNFLIVLFYIEKFYLVLTKINIGRQPYIKLKKLLIIMSIPTRTYQVLKVPAI
jgi:hypothetical protein